jgi:hypothetical protein
MDGRRCIGHIGGESLGRSVVVLCTTFTFVCCTTLCCIRGEDMARVSAKLPAELRCLVAASTSFDTTLEEWSRMRDAEFWEAMGLSVQDAFTEWVKAQPAGSGFGLCRADRGGLRAGLETVVEGERGWHALKFVMDHVQGRRGHLTGGRC